jgi:hypothetical protein
MSSSFHRQRVVVLNEQQFLMIDRWWSISRLKPLSIIYLVTCNIKTSFHRPLYCYYLTYINHTLLKEKKKKNQQNTEHWRDEQHGSITTKAFHLIVVILLLTITTSFHMPIFVINNGDITKLKQHHCSLDFKHHSRTESTCFVSLSSKWQQSFETWLNKFQIQIRFVLTKKSILLLFPKNIGSVLSVSKNIGSVLSVSKRL